LPTKFVFRSTFFRTDHQMVSAYNWTGHNMGKQDHFTIG